MNGARGLSPRRNARRAELESPRPALRALHPGTIQGHLEFSTTRTRFCGRTAMDLRSVSIQTACRPFSNPLETIPLLPLYLAAETRPWITTAAPCSRTSPPVRVCEQRFVVCVCVCVCAYHTLGRVCVNIHARVCVYT